MQLRRYRNLQNNLGTISHGTMRPEDLIPAFIDCLESQKPMLKGHRKLIREIQESMAALNVESDQTEATDYWESDTAREDLESLFEALGEYCLPYFYFGAHPGDGSDYGFWLSEDWQYDFEGIIESSNGFKTWYSQNGKTIDGIPKSYNGELASVNDHGNVTLYHCSRGRKYEVWSVV